MNTDKHNGHLVESLGSALRGGTHAVGVVPALLKRVLAEQSWRQFVTQRGERVEYQRFADFVTTLPLKGLGADVGLIKQIIRGDPEAEDMLDQALQNPNALHNVQAKAPTGNTRERALRKLRADAPDLHADVLAGRLSAHRAMVQAGFRPNTFTVPDTSPEAIAAALRRQLPADVIAHVAALLTCDRRQGPEA